MRRGDGARTPEGVFDLGMRYRTGEGMPQDHRGRSLFRLAADQGYAQARNIACCYRQGVPQNPSEAARYYHRPASNGKVAVRV
jgi:TPR repeat protein